jgi:hypothetical protein
LKNKNSKIENRKGVGWRSIEILQQSSSDRFRMTIYVHGHFVEENARLGFKSRVLSGVKEKPHPSKGSATGM